MFARESLPLLLQPLLPLVSSGGSAAAAAGSNPNLGYMSSWFFEGSEDPAAAKTWQNYMFTSADPAIIRKYHTAGLGPSLFEVRFALFCGHGTQPEPTGPSRLCPDYEARWQQLLNSTIRPMLAEHSIMGVFFGDELCWSCTPYSNLTAAVDLVRRDLPRGSAILYYNEAYPVLQEGICQQYPSGHVKLVYPKVPDGIDWVRSCCLQSSLARAAPVA